MTVVNGQWKQELLEVIKTQAERDAEADARRRARLAEALKSAEAALNAANEALRFCAENMQSKALPASIALLAEGADFKLGDSANPTCVMTTRLDRETAMLTIQFGEGKAKEFDFGRDRHIAPEDVDEYVGRRLLELVRTAKSERPW